MMGTKLVDIPIGVDCPDCWNTSGPYPYHQTPESVFATFSGISKGSTWSSYWGEPPNGRYQLDQMALPCQYQTPFLSVYVLCIFGSAYGTVTMSHPVLRLLFRAATTACKIGGPNYYDDPAGRMFYGGKVIISWRTCGRSWRT